MMEGIYFFIFKQLLLGFNLILHINIIYSKEKVKIKRWDQGFRNTYECTYQRLNSGLAVYRRKKNTWYEGQDVLKKILFCCENVCSEMMKSLVPLFLYVWWRNYWHGIKNLWPANQQHAICIVWKWIESFKQWYQICGDALLLYLHSAHNIQLHWNNRDISTNIMI